MRRALVRLVCLTMLFAAGAAVASDVSLNTEKPPILIGTTKSPDNFLGVIERRIYTEAFSRLNLRVQFIQMPLRRLDAALEHGDIDVEVPRQWDYLGQHPDLIRIDEPIFSITFVVYTANTTLKEQRMETFSRDLNVEFRRGVENCGRAMKHLFPEERISEIVTTEQGLRKLVNGRTDLYCDVDNGVNYLLLHSKTSEFAPIRKVSDLGPPVPLYTYLSKKNAALAPRLAKMLKEMKAEGLFERFREQAKQEAVTSPKSDK